MLSDETLLLLNRATLTTHTVRTAVHELNNVLQMVSGYAELLHDAPDLPPAAARRVEAILRQTRRGQGILEALTEMTRPGEPGSGRTEVVPAIGRVVESRRFEHLRAGIAVTVEPGGEAVRVAVPRAHLEQMILNLLLNAEQAVKGGATPAITVRVGAAAGAVTIAVEDSGPGVPAGLDPFAHFTTATPGASAGLGLPASRLLASRYDGALEPLGEGVASGWRLTLPDATPPS